MTSDNRAGSYTDRELSPASTVNLYTFTGRQEIKGVGWEHPKSKDKRLH